MSGSTSFQESIPKVLKWKEFKCKKIDVYHKTVEKE